MKPWIKGALATLAVLAAGTTAGRPTPVDAQLTCYDSYVTLSGRCPDSCGRGEDCPCTTCTKSPQEALPQGE